MMDEDLAIINSKTRSQKIKDLILNHKKKIILFLFFSISLIIIFFGLDVYNESKRIKISDKYNSIIIEFSDDNKEKTANELIEIINEKDPTYGPLSLYFIIENNLVLDRNKVESLFETLINNTSLDKEIKNLIIYKQALLYADDIDENRLLDLLSPLMNSDSVWKSHALYLVAEYFFSKNEKQKSKEFFKEIINLENANQDLRLQAQKRLNRDLGEYKNNFFFNNNNL